MVIICLIEFGSWKLVKRLNQQHIASQFDIPFPAGPQDPHVGELFSFLEASGRRFSADLRDRGSSRKPKYLLLFVTLLQSSEPTVPQTLEHFCVQYIS